MEAVYSRSILSLSAEAVEKTVEAESCSLQNLQPDHEMERVKVTDAQLETYLSGLVDIFLVDRLVEYWCGASPDIKMQCAGGADWTCWLD